MDFDKNLNRITAIATIITVVPIFFASFTWIKEGDLRQDQRINELWRTLYQTGGDAQKKALSKLRNEYKINNFYGLRLENANLNDFDFSHANLRSANLSNTSLKNANFQQANLCEARLDGANLQGANLQGALLIKANMVGTILVDAKIDENTNLEKANVRGANFDNVDNMTIEKVNELGEYDQYTTFSEHLRQHEPLNSNPQRRSTPSSHLTVEQVDLCSWEPK